MNTLIIAEAGVNHNGDIGLAQELIDVAVEAGADYIKFQSFKANRLVSPQAMKAKYQSKNFQDSDDKQITMLKRLELTHENHLQLVDYCKIKGIKFLSTAFDDEGLDYLNSLGLGLFKSPSGEITNFPYLVKLAELQKPVILSTGMSDLVEVRKAVDLLTFKGLSLDYITVLHCNTQYPTPMHDVNLNAMGTMKKALGVNVGYSDHTLGIEVPIAAVALGATVIEKHFTLDRKMKGPDHKASLEPGELIEMVKAIRNVEEALSGDGEKRCSPSERENMAIARKSIHLARNMQAGEYIKDRDLIPLRPGDGISPMNWNQIIGKRLINNLPKYHKLSLTDII